jgi:hypothetical protein
MADNNDAPTFFTVDPSARLFPVGWRAIWFRRNARQNEFGSYSYRCPTCSRDFEHADLDQLQGDHVWPYSLFGPTSWSNYQLICGACNLRKRDFLDADVRRALSDEAFRTVVRTYLRDRLDRSALADTVVKQLISP